MSRTALKNNGQSSRYPALYKGCYGWDACRLADEYDLRELSAAIEQIFADPANANPGHADGTSIHLLTKGARKRTEALTWAIFYRKQDAVARQQNSQILLSGAKTTSDPARPPSKA